MMPGINKWPARGIRQGFSDHSIPIINFYRQLQNDTRNALFLKANIYMKARRTVFLILGILFIVLNLLVEFTMPAHPYSAEEDNAAYRTGAFIGGNLFVIIGLIFIIIAYRTQRKIISLKEDDLKNLIDSIGKPRR